MSGESKQIDEDENGPENGGMKSGPCLIAGFHALNDISPSYYNPYRGSNKGTLSVDMVRLSLTFRGDRGEWLSRKGAQLTDCDEMSAWTSKIRPGGWYELWSFALGGSSVALGIGFMEPSCKVNMHKGFIEFNPNKVAGDKRFHGLLKTLKTCVSKARLKRFDLAFDIPVSRYGCRLSKDRRMYKSVISNGIIIPLVLRYAYAVPGALWFLALTVGAGELICCVLFGSILITALLPHRDRLFR